MASWLEYIIMIGILIPIVIFYVLNQKPAPTAKEIAEKRKTSLIKLTLEELKAYNGTNSANNNKIYLAVKGTIYDVSHRSNYYGPDGPYAVFAGHDVTLALAKSSLKEEDLNVMGDLDLNLEEKTSLESFVELYNKYKIVGEVKS